jgi:hypothetical protein
LNVRRGRRSRIRDTLTGLAHRAPDGRERGRDFFALACAYSADGVVVDGSSDVPAIVADIFGRSRKRPLLIDLRVDPELMFPLSKWEHYTPPPLANHRG